MSKILYPNTTQVSNYVLDNQNLFNDGELRVLLAITRNTIGWHKETDFMRYSQLIKTTGKSKPVVSKAVNSLIEKGLILRLDEKKKEIKKMPQGYRGEIYYTLNKGLVKKINQLKNLTSTGKESLPYKTNSYKTNNNSKAVVNKTYPQNGDRLGITPNGSPTKAQLLKEMGFDIKKGGATYEWQDTAARLADSLGIKENDKEWYGFIKRVFGRKQKALLMSTYAKVADSTPRDPKKYFFKVFNDSRK